MDNESTIIINNRNNNSNDSADLCIINVKENLNLDLNKDQDQCQNPNPNSLPKSVAECPRLRRIENSAQRQVTFCKRRTSLLKKAYELSILCDAKVAIVVFSPSGKLSQFCSPGTSMLHMFERYKRSHPESNLEKCLQQQAEYWRHETIRLRKEVEYFKNLYCQMMGESNLPLSIEEIENLESALNSAQGKLRTRKIELLQVQTQAALLQGDALSRENEILKVKLREVVEECATSSISNDSCCEYDVDTSLAL